MDLKKLLENKTTLKEDLAMYILNSRLSYDFLKENRHSSHQILLKRLEERVYSMNENEIIEYFDSIKLFATITICSFETDKDDPQFIGFGFDIRNLNQDLISGTAYPFKTRKEATIKCAEKLIELSN